MILLPPLRRRIWLLAGSMILSGHLIAPQSARAAVVTFESGLLSQLIPDDTDTGLSSTISLTDPGFVESVGVRLELSVPEGATGWFGDLYAYLRHEDGFSVLLNRPGRTAAAPFGYDDGQDAALTFIDHALNGDVHGYRTVLGGSESTSLVGALIGEWAPDGRAVDPAQAWDTTPRTALLGGFAGHSLAGNWTLFVADLSSGGQYRLDRWALDFETGVSAIPESEGALAVAGLGLLVIAGWRSWRARAKPERKCRS